MSDPGEVVLTEGIGKAIAAANRSGLLVVVATNQSGVARGLFQLDAVERVHRRIEELLAAESAKVDRFYCCPHHPTEGIGEYLLDCECRKPKAGMLLRAARELEIDLAQSFLIGDTRGDLEAGAAAGCKTFHVRTGHGAGVQIPSEDFETLNLIGIAENAEEAIQSILRR